MKRALLLVLVAASPAFGEGPVVTVGKPLDVSAPVAGRVISVGGSLKIRSAVQGDVLCWGGDVSFADAGSVAGDLIIFGGTVSGSEGRVHGRLLTPGSLAAIYLAEARQSPWRPPPASRAATFLGLRLLVLAVWLAAATLVLRIFGSGLARAALCLEESPGAAASAGLLTVVVLFLAGVAAVAGLPSGVGTPVALLILALAAALKVFGMSALFLFVGQKVSGRLAARRRPGTLTLGLLLAGGISLIPVAGPLLWSAFSVLAVGAAAFTRFGSPRFRVAIA